MMAASTPTMDSKRFQELVEESTFNHGSFADLYTCGVCDMKMWSDNIHEHLQSHVSVCTNYQFNNQTKTILPVFDNATPTSEAVGQKRKLPISSTVVKTKVIVKSPRKQTLYGSTAYSDAAADERERKANMDVESYLNSSTDKLSFLLDNLPHANNEPTYFAARPYPTGMIGPMRPEQPTSVSPKKNKGVKTPKRSSKPKAVAFTPETSVEEFTATTLSSTTLSSTTLSSSMLMKSEPLNIGDTLTKIDLPYVVEGKELGTYHCTVIVDSFTPKVSPKKTKPLLPRDKHGKFLKRSDVDLLDRDSDDDDDDDDYDAYMDEGNESPTSQGNSGELQDAVHSITGGKKPPVKTRIIPGGLKKTKKVKKHIEEKQGEEKVDGVKKRRRRRSTKIKPLTPHRSLMALRVSCRDCSWTDERVSALIVSELKKAMRYVAAAVPAVSIYFESVVEIEEFDIAQWAFKDLGPPDKVDIGTDPLHFSRHDHLTELCQLEGLSDAVKKKLRLGYTRYMQITDPEYKNLPEPKKATVSTEPKKAKVSTEPKKATVSKVAKEVSSTAKNPEPVSLEKAMFRQKKKSSKKPKPSAVVTDVVRVDPKTWLHEVKHTNSAMQNSNLDPKYGTLTIGKFDPVTNKFDVRIDVDPNVKAAIPNQQFPDKNLAAPASSLINLPGNVPALPMGLSQNQNIATSPIFYARPLNINVNKTNTVAKKDTSKVSESKNNLEIPCKNTGNEDKSEKVQRTAVGKTLPSDEKVKGVSKADNMSFSSSVAPVGSEETKTPVFLESDHDSDDDLGECTEMTNETSGENYEWQEDDSTVTINMRPPDTNLSKDTRKRKVETHSPQEVAGKKTNDNAQKETSSNKKSLPKTPDNRKLSDKKNKEEVKQDIAAKRKLVEKADGTVELSDEADELTESVKSATCRMLSKLNVQKGVSRKIIVYLKKKKTDTSQNQTPTRLIAGNIMPLSVPSSRASATGTSRPESSTMTTPGSSVGSSSRPAIVTSASVVSSSSVSSVPTIGPTVPPHTLSTATSASVSSSSAAGSVSDPATIPVAATRLGMTPQPPVINLQQPAAQMLGQIPNSLQPLTLPLNNQGLFVYNNTLYRQVPVQPQTNVVAGTVPMFTLPQQLVAAGTAQQLTTTMSTQQLANTSTAQQPGTTMSVNQPATGKKAQQEVKTSVTDVVDVTATTVATSRETAAANDHNKHTNKGDGADKAADRSLSEGAKSALCTDVDDMKTTLATGGKETAHGTHTEMKQEIVDSTETKIHVSEEMEHDRDVHSELDNNERTEPEADSKANIETKLEIKIECRICQLVFNCTGDFNEHNMKNHSFKEIVDFSLEKFQQFVCVGCGRTDPSMKTMALHKKYCNNSCRCGFHVFDLLRCYRNYQKRQLRKKHVEKIIRMIDDKTSVKKIKPTPKQLPLHMCPYCDFQTSSKMKRAKHVATCDNRPQMQCDLCSFESADKVSLEDHTFKVHRVKSAVCPHCKKEYKNQRALEVHVRWHEPEWLEKYSRTRKETICDICGKLLKDESHLQVHVAKLHTQEKSCLYCGMLFLIGMQCQAHEGVHTGDFRYSCATCQKVYSSVIKYYQHMTKIHNIKNEDSLFMNSILRQTRALIFTNICTLCPEKESIQDEAMYLKHMSVRHSMDEEAAKQARLKALLQEQTIFYQRRIELRHVHEVGNNAMIPVFPTVSDVPTEVNIQTIVANESISPQDTTQVETRARDAVETENLLPVTTIELIQQIHNSSHEPEVIEPEVKILSIETVKETVKTIAPVTAKVCTDMNIVETKSDEGEMMVVSDVDSNVVSEEVTQVQSVSSGAVSDVTQDSTI